MAKAVRGFLAKFHWWSLIVLAGAFAVWWSIALSGSFGDEQENFVASWLVQQGLVPYRDFFFHHAPLPYFLGSPLFLWKAAPWSEFRWLVFGWFVIVGSLTWKLVSPRLKAVVGFSWLGLALMAPALQLQQYLAESLMMPLVVSLFFLLVSYTQSGGPKLQTLLTIWLVFGWLMIGSTVVALPIWGWLGVGILGTIFLNRQRHPWRQIFWRKLGLLALLLWGGTVGYFWFQHALATAWWDVITYNFQYYFPVRLAANAEQVQLGYFLSVAQNFYHYGVTATTIVWQATNAFIHTLFTTVMASFSLPTSVLKNWLVVAVTEWQHKVVTLAVWSWLGWGLVALWLPKMRGKVFVMVWWLGLAMVLRGRENEGFKLGVYYAVIVAGMCGVSWLILTEWLKSKHKSIWLMIKVLLCVGWWLGWLSLYLPSYQQMQKLPPQIIPVKTLQEGEKLKMALDAAPAVQSQNKLYVLGGNPVFYLLTRRTPAIPAFYYHPWFHQAPELRSQVTEFLSTTQTVPVVMESELAGSSLQYAAELETLVRSRAVGHAESLYWMTQ